MAEQLTGGDPAHASTSRTSIENLTNHTEKNRVRVLLLVDHGLFRASLGLVLASDQDLEVVGECDMCCNAPALEVLRRSEPDVALLEFVSDAEPGPEIISAAKSAGYQGRFLILIRSTDVRNSAMAFRLGASGIFPETETPERLMQAIKLVADGHIWIDQTIVQLLVNHIANQPARFRGQASPRFQDDRERRVLLGIVDGLTNEKIGENIGMSESAVKNVVQRLFSRTGVRRRSQLVRAALEGSLVTMDELGSYRTARTADASSSQPKRDFMRKLRTPIVALMAVIALAPAKWANDIGFGHVTSPVRSMECNHVSAERRLAPSEVKELLKSASSPGDRLKLAAHFGEEVAREEAAANWHDQMADSSESSALRSRHKYLANNARRASGHAMKRAREQARIAQAMQNSPAAGTRHGR